MERLEQKAKITPEAAQYVMLHQISLQLGDVLQANSDVCKELQDLNFRVAGIEKIKTDEQTEGILEGCTLSITNTNIKHLLRECSYKDKWYEITIYNDGPGELCISSTASKRSRYLELSTPDTVTIPAKKGTKRELYVWCPTGATTVKVAFKR